MHGHKPVLCIGLDDMAVNLTVRVFKTACANVEVGGATFVRMSSRVSSRICSFRRFFVFPSLSKLHSFSHSLPVDKLS